MNLPCETSVADFLTYFEWYFVLLIFRICCSSQVFILLLSSITDTALWNVPRVFSPERYYYRRHAIDLVQLMSSSIWRFDVDTCIRVSEEPRRRACQELSLWFMRRIIRWNQYVRLSMKLTPATLTASFAPCATNDFLLRYSTLPPQISSIPSVALLFRNQYFPSFLKTFKLWNVYSKMEKM